MRYVLPRSGEEASRRARFRSVEVSGGRASADGSGAVESPSWMSSSDVALVTEVDCCRNCLQSVWGERLRYTEVLGYH